MAVPGTNNNNPDNTTDADNATAQDVTAPEVDFHGAAIIDDDGNITPITEEMVQKACSELEESRDTEAK